MRVGVVDAVLPFVGLDQAGQRLRIASHDRGLGRLAEGVTNVPQGLWVLVDNENARPHPPLAGLARVVRCGVGGLLSRRKSEGEPGATPRPAALRPDADSTGLHQSLVDRQARAGAPEPPLADGREAVLTQQLRQPVRRHAPALIGNQDRHMQAITRGRSSGRSKSRVCWPPPLRKVFLAWSTRRVTAARVTAAGSGETDSVPVSMRP